MSSSPTSSDLQYHADLTELELVERPGPNDERQGIRSASATSAPHFRVNLTGGSPPNSRSWPGGLVTIPWRGSEYLATKRWLDIGLIVLFAPLIVPVLCACALAVLVTMGRPVLFSQQRVGYRGSCFVVWKLRSMTFVNRKKEATADQEQHRITPLGAFLRKFRFDELPQLYNVLRGEMSVIGPRPEQPGLVERYRRAIPGFDKRHDVLPGISGLAQVTVGYCGNTAETRKKLRMDLLYIRNMSFTTDCAILWRSIRVVLTGYGSR